MWTAVYIFYVSLSTIYLYLPPMMAVLYVLFRNALNKRDSLALGFVIIALLVLEAEKSFLAFSLLIYFLIVYRFIDPKIQQSINLKSLRDLLYVLVIYIGYFLFYTLVSQIFLFEGIRPDLYIVYYIIIEYFIVSLLL